MTNILFVCHGNICRSPMAEFVMKHLAEQAGLSDKFSIGSAAVSREEIGNDIHPGTRKKLLERNIPFSAHTARQISRKDYDQYDYILVMDNSNLSGVKKILPVDPQNKIRRLLDFTGRPGEIADPWYTGDFEETYQDVLLGCQALLSYILKKQ